MDRETLRELLQTEKNELTARREKIDLHNHDRTVSKQFDEQSIERNNDEVVQALEVEALEELRAIEQALSRIETDQFDSCTDCDSTISDERLKAIPHTMVCRNCAT